MKMANLTWDEGNLDRFIKNPKKLIKKTKMSFAGIRSNEQRANLIAYLKTLADYLLVRPSRVRPVVAQKPKSSGRSSKRHHAARRHGN